LRHDDRGGNDSCGRAVGNDSSGLAAGNDDSALNSDGSDRTSWIGGSPRYLRGAREDGWVGADLVHADTLEVVLSRGDIAVGGAMSIETFVDRAHQGLRGAVAIRSGVGIAVAIHRNPSIQALRKDAWVWKRRGAVGSVWDCGAGRDCRV
jgi:hypothetical protein